MCHPRRDEPKPTPQREYIEPLSDESDEEMPETDTESEVESEDTEDTSIEESDETDDETEYIDVTGSEESHGSSSDDNFSSEEDARGRRLGHVSARRARHPQSPRYELSPFSSGLTFNGFTQNLVPEEIIGHTIVSPIEILLSVRWRNHPQIRQIEVSVMSEHRPDMVVDYLLLVIETLPDINFP